MLYYPVMPEKESRSRIHFYRNSRRGKILRALTASDISFWGTDAFISAIFILFAIQFIPGGSATHIGLAFLGNRTMNALSSIPAGKFFDRHKGQFDEIWSLMLVNLLTGLFYMALSFATSLWQLYVAMLLLGFFSAVNLAAWRVVFYGNISKNEYGQTVGVYQTFISIAQGIALALGGWLGDTVGFDKAVFLGGIVIALGSIFLLMIVRFFPKPSP